MPFFLFQMTQAVLMGCKDHHTILSCYKSMLKKHENYTFSCRPSLMDRDRHPYLPDFKFFIYNILNVHLHKEVVDIFTLAWMLLTVKRRIVLSFNFTMIRFSEEKQNYFDVYAGISMLRMPVSRRDEHLVHAQWFYNDVYCRQFSTINNLQRECWVL